MTQPMPPEYANTQPLRGRWERELTARELKKALQSDRYEIAVSEKMGMEFFAIQSMYAIIRTSGMGGDTYTVHGGWKYPNFIAYLQDWIEIKSIADRVTRWKRR